MNHEETGIQREMGAGETGKEMYNEETGIQRWTMKEQEYRDGQ